MENKKYFTATEFADYFNVSRQTVNNWINQDKINYVVLPSGTYRIPRSEVKRIVNR